MSPRSTDVSAEILRNAERVIPGGVNSPVRAFKAVGGVPPVIARGDGSRVYDVDGNEYVDYVGSWGPLVLGHADRRVVGAVQAAATSGTTFGAPTAAERDLAELVVDTVPSADMVRCVSSGTEACMTALRLARGFTGRDLVLKFAGGYHGHADPFLVQAGSGSATLGRPDSAGVPDRTAELTLVAPYNNASAAEAMFDVHEREIAAIIVEPIAANMGVVPPADGYLEALREISDRHGAVLIFDEVITGFRVARGGAQELYGVTPDLTCLGKIMGGGLPLAAVCGRRELMELLAPTGPVYQAGTLSGNPLAIAAGIETLKVLGEMDDAYGRLDGLGALLEQGLTDAVNEAGIAARINRVGSLLTLFFTTEHVIDFATSKGGDSERFARFFNGMLDGGCALPPSAFEAWFISLAHSRDDIKLTIEAARAALGTMTGAGTRT